jgi:hypothetical protein
MMAAAATGHNPARSHGTETQAQATGPPIFWRSGRAYADLRAYADVGGGREALCEPDSKWGTTEEAIAEALFAARVTELQERRRGRVGADGGKRHTTLLVLYGELLLPDDTPLLERLVRESRTWALVDGLAASVAGSLVERFPDAMHPRLARWAKDDDFWLRRASLLAYLTGLRRGAGHFDRFTALADPMLEDRELFIRKAIGWVLRETARKRPELVTRWLEPRRDRASGLTVREAYRHIDR